jgi:hypothetical protein
MSVYASYTFGGIKMKIEEREITKKDINLNLNMSTNRYKDTLFNYYGMCIAFIFLFIVSLSFYIFRRDNTTLILSLVSGGLSSLFIYIIIEYRKKRHYQNKYYSDFLCPKCYMIMDDNEEHTIYSCYVCNFRILDPNVKFYKHFSDTLSWTKEDLKWEKYNSIFLIVVSAIVIVFIIIFVIFTYNKNDITLFLLIIRNIMIVMLFSVLFAFLYGAIISSRKLIKSPK